MSQTTNELYRQKAIDLLENLVTERGIFASADNGWSGAFHSWFGRDSAVVANLIFAAEAGNKEKHLSEKAYRAALNLKTWQGAINDPTTGEEAGKIPHEIRAEQSHNKQTEQRAEEFSNLWTHYPERHASINWDSADSTPLWIITIARWHELASLHYDKEVLAPLQAALEWCLNNLQQYGGLAGFTGADLQPQRKGGMHNQGWKDSEGVYQYADGSLAKHPIYDVFVNGIFWAALRWGAEIFSEHDAAFAQELQSAAARLKARFNDPQTGFLLADKIDGLNYFSEALDGDHRQLEATAVDPALCLWASFRNECVIDEKYIGDVVRRVLQPDMLNPDAGARNYSANIAVPKVYSGGYHRSPNTYWPFVSGLLSNGLEQFSYANEARQVAVAALNGISHFGSCIEMYLEPKPGEFTPWQRAGGKQRSSADQAWTAAALYFMTSLL